MTINIKYTEKDILEIEKILLVKFDDQRKDFIKNFDTIDLQACPWSWKTTCLLAKFLILENNLPFNDWSWVLILSHTNTAVNEIKNKIWKYCPKLLNFPNYIWTFQSFVDSFLAIPYYKNISWRNVLKIDNEYYHKEIINNYYKNFTRNDRYWIKSKFQNKQDLEEKFIMSYRFNNSNELVNEIWSLDFKYKNTTKPTYKKLFDLKKDLLDKWILCYDDAYYLANRYLEKLPIIKNILQKRFSYVFIDEMQDTDLHQIQIINDIFGNSNTIIQRIWDNNQSIYNNVKETSYWQISKNILPIDWSLRFSESIANSVKSLWLNPQDLKWNSNIKNIRPKIILYDENTISLVMNSFWDEIKKNDLHNKEWFIAKAIWWIWDPDKKVSIWNYFNEYNKEFKKEKKVYSNLDSYISSLKNSKDKIISDFYNILLEIVIHILFLEKIKTDSDLYYNKVRLLEKLNNEFWDKFKEFKYGSRIQS